jgi:hypothetical protein
MVASASSDGPETSTLRAPAAGPRHAGAIEHHIDARKIERAQVVGRVERDRAPVHHQAAALLRHRAGPGAEHAVILEQVGAGADGLDLVDAGKLEFRAVAQHDAQDGAADATEPVDGDSDRGLGHGGLPVQRSTMLTVSQRAGLDQR